MGKTNGCGPRQQRVRRAWSPPPVPLRPGRRYRHHPDKKETSAATKKTGQGDWNQSKLGEEMRSWRVRLVQNHHVQCFLPAEQLSPFSGRETLQRKGASPSAEPQGMDNSILVQEQLPGTGFQHCKRPQILK